VYRVIWIGAKPSKTFDLAGASNDKLLEALKSDNMLWRMHAQRLLVEHGDKSVIPALTKLAEDPSVDEIGLNPTAVHALWTIHGLTAGADSSAAAQSALHHPAAGVRKAAVDTLPRTGESVKSVLDARLLADPDAQVRKSSLLALSEMLPSLVTSEDYSLLAGSLAVFVLLAIAMVLTRRLDWYQATTRPQPE